MLRVRSSLLGARAPSLLVGEGWGGGWWLGDALRRMHPAARPPPPTPPHKGEGSTPHSRRRIPPDATSSSRRAIAEALEIAALRVVARRQPKQARRGAAEDVVL